MLGILLFAIGVMYTPGPVNILSLNSGMQKQFRAHIPFCFGVAGALCLWFIFIGYTGSVVLNDNMLPIVALGGVCFVLYLAYKILSSKVEVAGGSEEPAVLTYRDGFFMQILNPKSMLVVLPVTTVQFPAAGIEGVWISIWSVFLGALGFGAPLSYAVLGTFVGRRIRSTAYLKYMNIIMGLMLVMVAADMGYNHVYLALLSR